MRSLYELTKLQNLRHSAGTRPSAAVMEQDFIAQGLVSRETAEALFARFQQVNNRLLWDGILLASPAASLDAVRRASSLLAAVVLAVGALHSPGREEAFHRSYDVFVALARRSALARRHSLDDVAALCIGAFYLANLSWKLSGLASRIAAEIGLHQAYSRLIHANSPHHTDRDNDIYLSHRRVRLWYAVYVCDRQFSIAHGRPPASVDDESTRNLQRFLRGPAAEAGDTRLAAQVALCSILTDAYFAFGSDADRPLGETEMARLRDSTAALDAWRAEWPPRAHDCPAVRSYPAQALVLYFHFARFQLNSLALRGVSAQSPALLSREHRAAASTAIAAAMSTLTLIVDDDDLRAAFPGVPVFTYTMVAFCATFLLKMAATWGRLASGEVYPDEIVSLVHRSADMLARVAAHVNERHLARHIATGMAEMLQQFRAEQAAQDADSLGFALHSSSSSSSAPVLPPASVDESSGVYNFRDLEGTFGFGLDETLLGEMAADSFELW
ncbi:hypothetical protein ASPZODRAFT_136059 [Penicilliopsis zonata CBS 506.65]|uniref:Xylanolytic transcriptional activator regulatory domain-containing protein n=1 Tax=Penicilliopsis zonata CBS 506.65 TaxID=1073090 RepID=A0A1L9S8X1_9EURO|nr:hypothetical protein ASPZODRAFT_136059 [Penicilliopsis zonata CBS 506.65]OJJ43605.1 hypothetical protein ASPZODRAFT_136059 [Penicilliopsis zonata CBS 506.65]